MDQTQDPNSAGDKKNEIDLDRILLPKKEVHTSASAQRVSAGVLLEQEVRAGAETPAAPQKPKEDAAAEPKPEESEVKQLQTYQSDIERLVQNKNVSVVSIAAAEAQRRASTPSPQEPGETSAGGVSSFLKTAAIAGGVLLVAAATGLLAFVFLRPSTSPVQTATITAPFISVDDTAIITLTPGQSSRLAVLQTLEAAKRVVHLSLGLVEQLYLATQAATDAASPPVSTQTLLGLLAPGIPQEFLRTLSPTFLLGVHSFDQNQPFLILSTDSYQGGYAGMLAWESTMQNDLSPLFDYTPSPHLKPGVTATSTATSTPFSQKAFVDMVVENHSARVIQNTEGDILLLWTFLDREIIVITTNEYTLREIISRVRQTPTLPTS